MLGLAFEAELLLNIAALGAEDVGVKPILLVIQRMLEAFLRYSRIGNSKHIAFNTNYPN